MDRHRRRPPAVAPLLLETSVDLPLGEGLEQRSGSVTGLVAPPRLHYFRDGGLKEKSMVAAPPETVAVPFIAGIFSCQASIS